MRLLGKCPHCGADDTIVTNENSSDPTEWNRATCNQCNMSWKNWLNLVLTEKEKGRRFIPVLFRSWQWGKEVELPLGNDMPCIRLIVSVLNTALMVRFRLQVCFAAEGGLKGCVEREPIELRNFHEKIGLCSDHLFQKNPVCQKILSWYAAVLRILLEDELVIGEKNFGRGAILKLPPQDPLYEERAKNLLWFALWKKTGSQGFANAVFERMQFELADPFSGPHLAGLTDEQIVQFFVPPPLS